MVISEVWIYRTKGVVVLTRKISCLPAAPLYAISMSTLTPSDFSQTQKLGERQDISRALKDAECIAVLLSILQ